MARRSGAGNQVRRCRLCRCTDLNACEGGCWWVESNLCSTCKFQLDLMVECLHTTARNAARWAFVYNYVGGEKTISRREPSKDTHYLSDFYSGGYAQVIGSDRRTARRALRRLVAEGFVIEDPRRSSGVVRFRVSYEIHVAMGREIIAELQAEGLPFDDDWRRSRDG